MDETRPLGEAPEAELIDWVYRRPVDHVGVPPLTSPPIRVRLRVPPLELGLQASAFGDVDALLLQDSKEQESRAIEFKRVKVSDRAFDTLLPNKLQELSKAVDQANRLAAAGFAWVWISVVVLTDTTLRATSTNPYVTAPPSLLEMTRTAIPLNKLRPEVGVYINEIAGPSADYRSLGGSILRNATPRVQPATLSDAIRKYFDRTPDI